MIMDTLLFNPKAGAAQRLGLTSEQLLGALESRGIRAGIPQEEMTEEETAEFARQARGRVIVAGGDGTIHCVLKAVNTCPILQLAIIPMGTANHFATALNLPTDVTEAIDVIARGHTRRIDLGTINGTVFTQAAGAGMHARAFRIYGEQLEKRALDAAATAFEIARSCEALAMRVRIDDLELCYELSQVTVANTPTYGRLFTVAPDAKIDDGLLDVVIIGRLSKLELMEYALAAITGTLSALPKTETYRGRRIEIEAAGNEPVEIHADATPAGFTPATVEVLPGCLEVVVPEANRS